MGAREGTVALELDARLVIESALTINLRQNEMSRRVVGGDLDAFLELRFGLIQWPPCWLSLPRRYKSGRTKDT
jgi:hypothetical protein